MNPGNSQTAQSVVEEYFEAARFYAKQTKNGRGEMRPLRFNLKGTLCTITWKKQGFECEKGRMILTLSREVGGVAVPLLAGADVLVLPDSAILKRVPVEARVKAILRKGEAVGLELHVTRDLGVVCTTSGENSCAGTFLASYTSS